MKIVQLLGSRNKTDFALYLAHTITSSDKRVLVVDATADEVYRYGYVRYEENEYLHDLQKVEILCGARSWPEVEKNLAQVDEKVSNYDCIILDTDNLDSILADWPKADCVLYVSDNDRFNLMRDIPYLHRYLDENNVSEIRRIHFDSAFHLPYEYIQLLMNNCISFTENSKSLEYDEMLDRLRVMMQHEQVIPYSKLNKEYKLFLNELACELFDDLTIRDVQKLARNGLFSLRPKKKYMDSPEQVIGG